MSQTNTTLFDLDFFEAIKLVLENKGWIQGENFASGLIICLEKDFLTMKQFPTNNSKVWQGNFTPSVRNTKQKYRLIHFQAESIYNN